MNELFKKNVSLVKVVYQFDISEIHKYQKKIDGWDVVKMKRIFIFRKKFTFKNFVESQNL